MHKIYVHYCSPILQAIFDRDYTKATKWRVVLPEMSPEAFNMFQAWFYSQNLHRVMKNKGEDLRDVTY